MKRAMIGLLVGLSLSVPAVAEEKVSCKSISILAKEIMQARQIGVEMAAAYEVMESDFSRSIVREAFSKSKYQTKPMQEQAITEFGNLYFGICLEMGGE